MERRVAIWLACFVVLTWIDLSTAQAEAQAQVDAQAQAQSKSMEPPEYRRMIDEALDEYEAHNFAEARALFQRAHGKLPSARTLRGLGMAEFELKNYRESVQRLEAALASPVKHLEGDLRIQTEALLARARTFVSRFRLRTTPASPSGLRLSVDGAAVPLEPDSSFMISVGEHMLLVQADGYVEMKRTLSVVGAESSDLFIELRKEQGASAPASALKPMPDQPARPLSKNAWLWTGVGAVVVGGVVAGIVLSMHKKKSSEDPHPEFTGDFGGRVQTLEHAR